MESYIHRSGRTGRAGRTGVCICFYQRKEEDQLRYVENKAVCLLLVPVLYIGYSTVTVSRWTFIAGHHFQTRRCSHCQWHHQVIKQRCRQVSVMKFDIWILFQTLGLSTTSDWLILSHIVDPDCLFVGSYPILKTLMPFVFFFSGFWTLFRLQLLVTFERQLRSWLKKGEQLTLSLLRWLISLELQPWSRDRCSTLMPYVSFTYYKPAKMTHKF